MANRFTTFPESWWAYMPKPSKLLSDDLKALEAIVAAGGTPGGTEPTVTDLTSIYNTAKA